MNRVTLSVSVVGVIASAACASPVQPDEDDKRPDLSKAFDFTVPESPAFVILGISPENVVRPTSMRQLSASILNAAKGNGDFSLEFNPFRLEKGKKLTLADYRKNTLLYNTQISLAKYTGKTDSDKSTHLAIGLYSILNQGDPALSTELDKTYAEILSAAGPLTPDMSPSDYDRKIATKLRDETKKVRAKAEGKPIFSIAAAPCFVSPTASDSYKWDGYGAWLSYSFGMDKKQNPGEFSTWSHQLIFHGRIRTNEKVADPITTGAFTTQDTTFYGVRYRAGGAAYKMSLEYYNQSLKLKGTASKSTQFLSLLMEPHISQDVWATLGVNYDTSGNSGAVGFRTSLKYGFNGL